MVAKLGYTNRHCPGIHKRSLAYIDAGNIDKNFNHRLREDLKKIFIHLALQLTDCVPTNSRYSLADERCPLGLCESTKGNT